MDNLKMIFIFLIVAAGLTSCGDNTGILLEEDETTNSQGSSATFSVENYGLAMSHAGLGRMTIKLSATGKSWLTREDPSLTVHFSDPVDPATLTAADVILTADDGSGAYDITATHTITGVNLLAGNTIAVVLLNNPLPNNTGFCFTLSDNVRSASGATLEASEIKFRSLRGNIQDTDDAVNMNDVTLMGANAGAADGTIDGDGFVIDVESIQSDYNGDGTVDADDQTQGINPYWLTVFTGVRPNCP